MTGCTAQAPDAIVKTMKQEMSYSVLFYILYTVVPLFICKDINSKPQAPEVYAEYQGGFQ